MLNGFKLLDAGKMTISLAPAKIPIATPFQLTVTLPADHPNGALVIAEKGSSGAEIPGVGGSAKLIREDGGAKVIEVIPAQLGWVTIEIAAINVHDMSIMQKDIQVYVYPVAKGLKRFDLGVGKKLDLSLDGERHGERWLKPNLIYMNLGVVNADDAEAINLTVDQPEDDPVIRLDRNGLIHPLRPGKATILGDVEGVQDRVEVTVYGTRDEVPKLARTSR